MRNKYDKLETEIQELWKNKILTSDEIVNLFKKYEESNLNKIKKLNKRRSFEHNRIRGGLKQTINAHSVITKELIPSATKRIYGALLTNEKSKKEKTCEKISSIYHTFVYILIFIIKLKFMCKNKDKICVTISNENNKKLISESINKSKLIDKLLTEYFKNK